MFKSESILLNFIHTLTDSGLPKICDKRVVISARNASGTAEAGTLVCMVMLGMLACSWPVSVSRVALCAVCCAGVGTMWCHSVQTDRICLLTDRCALLIDQPR